MAWILLKSVGDDSEYIYSFVPESVGHPYRVAVEYVRQIKKAFTDRDTARAEATRMRDERDAYAAAHEQLSCGHPAAFIAAPAGCDPRCELCAVRDERDAFVFELSKSLLESQRRLEQKQDAEAERDTAHVELSFNRALVAKAGDDINQLLKDTFELQAQLTVARAEADALREQVSLINEDRNLLRNLLRQIRDDPSAYLSIYWLRLIDDALSTSHERGEPS